jgi:hypothetical protein
MITNGFVTVFHAGGRETYKAHIYSYIRTAAENGGVIYQNETVIRIPTKKAIDIECGDYVAEGMCTEEKPKERRKIISVSASLFGHNPHYKITAV